MQTLRKKSSPCKYRNDRFFGDGVTFKAKLIGILEVGEARGDRMCQEALQDLKMAIRAAGEHKQRITIHVTIEGLRLRDEKTGDSLYHHPVHKISFIAQDMTDSRAFGYIFGSPDSGHRFFGIKTDKAASQVVLAMRDLFQVVFELKKKEIELARQQIQSKSIHEPLPLLIKNTTNNTDLTAMGLNITVIGINKNGGGKSKEPNLMSPESVQDLVDLEQELSSIQRGITQMERITPSEPTPTLKSVGFNDEDPFGDSFTNFSSFNILPPPPETTRVRHSKPLKSSDSITQTSTLPNTAISTGTSATITLSSLLTSQINTTNTPNLTQDTTESWINELEKSDVFIDSSNSHKSKESSIITDEIVALSQQLKSDVFTDLDPLGTGKNKPYVDKKYFFQDLKNPPKKMIKDLSSSGSNLEIQSALGTTATFSSSFPAGGGRHESFDIDNVFNESFDGQQTGIVDFNQQPQIIARTDNNIEAEDDATAPRDTDPFSPTRKKSDPFQDGSQEVFSKLDPFDFEFKNSKLFSDTKITSATLDETKSSPQQQRTSPGVFNGPLQVNLPPEWQASSELYTRMNRQASESPTNRTNRPSVFKQNTVDVISSISSKKMPHLFGQKFTKRDSHSINMRRLQESDSLSENETAPEPPPRPDFSTHIEPPPLPPKKQFSDIVIRPRITSCSAIPPPPRYDYISARIKSTSQDATSSPPIPLPSRRIGRSDSSFPGPGRPRKPGGDDDDYLAPITNESPLPLLPPPQTAIARARPRRQETLDTTAIKERNKETSTPIIVPEDNFQEPEISDITLSQLLTLGIDELAKKLNVAPSKLNTMTLVELTTYLSEFIEKSKKPKLSSNYDSPIFKVNFDQNSEFVAKFDDNFGEDDSFVANFSNDIKPEPHVLASGGIPVNTPESSLSALATMIPSADRYAVFREIIDKELRNESFEIKSSPEDEEDEEFFPQQQKESVFSEEDDEDKSEPPVHRKIDTKITEVIANAKDRYAALRDIILSEDLFEKPLSDFSNPTTFLQINAEFDQNLGDFNNQEETESIDPDKFRDSSPDSNKIYDVTYVDENEVKKESIVDSVQSNNVNGSVVMSTLNVSGNNKDDLEIDELMNRAISNLSLDSRLSPNIKSPQATESPNQHLQQSKVKSTIANQKLKSQFNDMSTSPIPIQKSPALIDSQEKSPLSKSPLAKLPITRKLQQSGSLSDMVCGSSPDVAPSATKQEWVAVFDNKAGTDKKSSLKSPKDKNGESPVSSSGDTKEQWKNTIGDRDLNNSRRWPGQTSSSSRDLSPWDDENTEYNSKKRIPDSDRRGYYMRHSRRMNSCDEDYEYEDEIAQRRKVKSGLSRSRENFEFGPSSWYQIPHGMHHSWSPQDEDERTRAFDRGIYERSSYGPSVYEKRKIPLSYDRRNDYKITNYDKRKCYRDYCRSEHDSPYNESSDVKERGKYGRRPEYENVYEESGFGGPGIIYKSREYYGERRSFDRESMESYESGSNRRRKSFGSGEVYGSFDSRDEFRDRYLTEKSRSLRKSLKLRSSTPAGDDYEQDSENDVVQNRVREQSRSLQRPSSGSRIRKSSGSSPWDGEEAPPIGLNTQKNWKRPSSASESERRLQAERRAQSHTLSGSDGEKDKRTRRKQRSRGKDVNLPPPARNYRDNFDYVYNDYDKTPPTDEDKFEKLNRRRLEMNQRIIEAERRKRVGSSNNKFNYDDDGESSHKYYMGSGKKEVYYGYEKERYNRPIGKYMDIFEEAQNQKKSSMRQTEFSTGFEDFEDTPKSNVSCSSNKFNFEGGFESDFNSSPPESAAKPVAPSGKTNFRFDNQAFEQQDFPTPLSSTNQITPTTITQKLRFDDTVTISKFDNSEGAFEDDFSKAQFEFEPDEWTEEKDWNKEGKKNNMKINKRQQQQDHIRKSESVNIFAKKMEDPFEDDEFFQSTGSDNVRSNGNNERESNAHNGNGNFAKFDENM